MHKIGGVIVVCALIFVVYLVLLVVMPVLVDFTYQANATINASVANVTTRMPGATEGLIMAPWALFFAPAIIGVVVIVIILKGYQRG